MAHRLRLEDLQERIDCFGEFDRADEVCLSHCSLNFECAAAREQFQNLELWEESLEILGCPHQA